MKSGLSVEILGVDIGPAFEQQAGALSGAGVSGAVERGAAVSLVCVSSAYCEWKCRRGA